MRTTQTPMVIRAEHVHLEPERVLIGAPRIEPQIEIIRDGEVIQAIEVICSCGERIRIHCEF